MSGGYQPKPSAEPRGEPPHTGSGVMPAGSEAHKGGAGRSDYADLIRRLTDPFDAGGAVADMHDAAAAIAALEHDRNVYRRLWRLTDRELSVVEADRDQLSALIMTDRHERDCL